MPPAMLPPMPGNVDPAALPEAQRAVLMRLATEVDGVPFIPALYRQLAHWPAVLAWLADELRPRFQAPETGRGAGGVPGGSADGGCGYRRAATGGALGAAPDEATTQRVLAAIARYAVTSPEMTMFGRLVLEALPAG